MVLVAEEYYDSKDYSNALTFLNNVLPQYRREGWQLLVQKVLKIALQSAYLSADAMNFIRLGFESICSCSQFSTEDNIAIQESIHNIMRKQLPLFLSFIDPNESENALKLWSNALQSFSEPIIFTIKMESTLKFIECKPKFRAISFQSNESIKLDLYLQSNCPNPVKLTKLNLLFSNSFYNQFCELSNTCGDEDSLILIPLKLQKFAFDIIPLTEDIDKSLTISEVNATLISDSVSTIIQWTFEDNKTTDSFEFTDIRPESKDIKQITCLLSTCIAKPISKLKLDIIHNQPALLNEYYSTTLSIRNTEDFDITNLEISAKVFDSNNDEITTGFQSLIWKDNQLTELMTTHSLRDIKVNEQISEHIIFKLENVDKYFIVLFVYYISKYEIQGQIKEICLSVSERVTIDVIIPFVTTFELTNLSLGKVSQVRVSEPVFLNVITKQNTDIPIDIIESVPQFHQSISCLFQTHNELKDNNCIDETFKIVSSEEHSIAISLGVYSIKWKRKCQLTNSQSLTSEISVPLPTTTIMKSPVFVEMKYPDVCVARNPVILSYSIHNRMDTDLSVELSMGTSDNFMYSGNKLVSSTLPTTINQIIAIQS